MGTSHPEKMTFYLQEAKDLAIPIIAPDINRSLVNFTVVKGSLLFGLQGIKNIGLTSLENIIAEREKKPFLDLLDFCQRIDLRTSNKRVVENLIYAGAFDAMPGNRAQKYEELPKIIERAIEYKKEKTTGQMGLFAIASTDEDVTPMYEFQPLPAWDDKKKLEHEKEVVGFYLSAHPLDSYQSQLRWLNADSFEQSLNKAKTATGTEEPLVIGCGLLKSSKVINTKKGDRMAFLQLEDCNSKAEIIVFPKVFKKIEPWLSQYHVFVVKGSLDLMSNHTCKIKANELVPMELLFQEWPSAIHATFQLPCTLR